jgi:hypothetical protein
VERFCDEALWLEQGHPGGHGDPKRVVDAYLTAVEAGEEQLLANTTRKAVAAGAGAASSNEPAAQSEGDAPPDMFQAVEGRWGSREVELAEVQLLDPAGQPSFVFHSGDAMSVRLKVRATAPVDDFVFGVSLFNADGVCCYGTNTYLEEMEPDQLRAAETEVLFQIDSLDLVEGTYKLDVAVHKRDGFPYDYHRQLYTFRVKSRTRDVGIYRPRHRWTFSEGIRFKQSRT